LQSFGVFIGDDLNVSLDNLSYTFLFRRPAWYLRHREDKRAIDTGLGILEKHLATNEPFSLAQKRFIMEAAFWNASHRLANKHRNKPRWIYGRLAHLLRRNETDLFANKEWGWKEPNSHMMLDHLVRYFPGLKYIHTVRHGLDMAYSSNQSQLFNWGNCFGIQPPRSEEEVPSASLRYWVEANKRILDKQELLGKDKVLVLNFDRVCREPAQELHNMVDFLGIEVAEEQFEQAKKIPVTPESSGRFRKVGSFDRKNFQADDLEFLESLGFSSM
jgi:hypothetical protein